MSQETTSEQPPDLTKTSNRQPKDPIFKRLLQSYFEQEQLLDSFVVTTGVQVGQLQLEIDATITASNNLSIEEIRLKLAQTPFRILSRHNFMEFKSISDPLTEADFARITARANLGWADRPHGVARTEVVSCIVSAAKPRELIKQVKPGGKAFRQIKPGIFYHPGFFMPIYLIVCNLLPVEEENFPLLVFSSGNKLKSYLEKIIDLELEVYLNYVVTLHPQETEAYLKNRRGKMNIESKKAIMDVLLEDLQDKQALLEVLLERERQSGGQHFLDSLVEMIGPDRIVQILGKERVTEALNKTSQPE